MTPENHIHARFLQGQERQRIAFDLLAEPLARAAEALVGGLMREGKVLVCGQGSGAAPARLFASLLANGHRHARPGLAALALDGQAQALADDRAPAEALARQVESLGQPGDVLLAISDSGNAPGVLAALRAAQSQGLPVVLITAGEGGLLAEFLGEEDLIICVPAAAAADLRTLFLHAIHGLCDGIDYLLLGA